MNLLVLSVIEALYVIYMLNYFKTKYSLAHPLTYFENKFLYHPIGKSDKPICNICKLGNYGAFIIAILIFLRYIYITKLHVKTLKLFNIFCVFGIFVLCLLNMNAVVYLIPFFIMEYLLIKKNYKL